MIKKFGDNYYNLPIFLKQMLTVFNAPEDL